jgi:hypothetical protein
MTEICCVDALLSLPYINLTHRGLRFQVQKNTLGLGLFLEISIPDEKIFTATKMHQRR